MKYHFDSVRSHTKQNNSLVGNQLMVKLKDAEIVINAPPSVVDGLISYFDLIKTDMSDFMVGSPKDILVIEADSSDKNEFKRAAGKFVEIFRDRLFGTSPANMPNAPSYSITELKRELYDIKRKADDIDVRAKSLQIDPDEYSIYRSQINESIDAIQDNFNKLSGHFNKTYNIKKWLNDDEHSSMPKF